MQFQYIELLEIQKKIQKGSFKFQIMLLIIFFFLIAVDAQLLKKVSNCLDSCLTCEIYEPTTCVFKQSNTTCQRGYFYNRLNKKCQLRPSLQSNFYVKQFTDKAVTQQNLINKTDWNQEKISQCSYINEKGVQKYFNAIGLFKQIYSISKQFEVSQHHQTHLFSFNLLRTSWMPHNDFLIVDIEAEKQLLNSYEIFYDNRESMAQQNLIVCNQQSLVTQKFSFKINPKPFTASKIKITFTGFLFTSVWGITNVKLVTGCQKFTVYNKLTQNCDFCDLGFYPVYSSQNYFENQLIRCKKCQFQCLKCSNQSYCTSCIKGYRLLANNTCIRNEDYARIQLKQFVNVQERNCQTINQSFYWNYEKNYIETFNYTNKASVSFGKVIISFQFFYNVKFQANSGSVEIKTNNVKINQIKRINLTNKGFQACSNESLERYSVSKFSLNLDNISETLNFSFLLTNQCAQCKFGISNLNIFFVQQGSVDSLILANIKTFSSQKQAFKSINLYNLRTNSQLDKISQINRSQNVIKSKQNKQQTIQYKTSSQIQPSSPISQLIRIKQLVQIPVLLKNKTSEQDSHQIITTNTSKQSQSSVNVKQKTSKQSKSQSNKIQQAVQLDKKNLIDHMAFSKSGNNGIILRLDNKTSILPKMGSTLIMELSSTSKDQANSNKKQKILYKAVANQNSVSQLFGNDANYQRIYTLTFYTDRTYLDDNVTIYEIKGQTKTKLATFIVERTDFLENDAQQVLSQFQNLFSFLAWIALTTYFIALLVGKGFLVEQYIQSIQFVFLGIYIFSSYLPASIVNTIAGLRRLQNFDFFIQNHLEKLQQFFVGHLVQNGPLRFTLFHKDINFIRGTIPLLFFLLIITLWFLFLYIYRIKFLKQDAQPNQPYTQNITNLLMDQIKFKKFFDEHVCTQITNKKLNFFIQVLKAVFLPLIFLSFKQFNNFSYPTEYSGQIINMLYCLFVFIGLVAGAICLVLYCSGQYFKLQYEQFASNFQSIYFKKIPKNYLPTEHHRLIHPLFRYLKIFIFTLLVALLGDYATAVTIIMIVLNVGQIFYSWFYQIYQDSLHFKFFITDAVMQSFLLLITLILNQITGIISTGAYLSIGYIYMSLALVIITNGFARSVYLILNHVQKFNGAEKRQIYQFRSERIV